MPPRPDADFYGELAHRAVGIPAAMFPVLFALGRMPGWITRFLELRNDPDSRILRPRRIYVAEREQAFVPREERG